MVLALAVSPFQGLGSKVVDLSTGAGTRQWLFRPFEPEEHSTSYALAKCHFAHELAWGCELRLSRRRRFVLHSHIARTMWPDPHPRKRQYCEQQEHTQANTVAHVKRR